MESTTMRCHLISEMSRFQSAIDQGLGIWLLEDAAANEELREELEVQLVDAQGEVAALEYQLEVLIEAGDRLEERFNTAVTRNHGLAAQILRERIMYRNLQDTNHAIGRQLSQAEVQLESAMQENAALVKALRGANKRAADANEGWMTKKSKTE